MILAKQLKQLLKNKDLTAAKLSRATGINQKTLSEWLSGRTPRDLDQIKILSEYLEVEIGYLLFGEVNKLKNKDLFTENINEINAGVFEVVLRKVNKD